LVNPVWSKRNNIVKNFINGKQIISQQQYKLTKRKSQHTELKATKEIYHGMVYDVTVPNGTLYVRRNGKPVWTCNCAVFGVSPESIGFTDDSNKAVAETQWEIGKERGLFPLAQFIKELLDEMIQEDLNYDEFEFIWTNLNPTNRLEEAKTFQILVNSGAVSIDEWRMAEGYRPIGAANYISTPIGPIFVHDLVEQSERGLDPAMPYTQVASPLKGDAAAAPAAEGGGGGRADTTNPETARAQAREEATGIKTGSEGRSKKEKEKADFNSQDVISEIRKWKKVAKNDLKQNRDYRNFYSDILDTRTSELIKMGLGHAKTMDDINLVFEPFLQEGAEKVESLKDLYGRIKSIIST